MKKYPVEQRKIPSIRRDIQILIFHPKTAKKEATAGVEASVDVDPNWFHAYDMFFV